MLNCGHCEVGCLGLVKNFKTPLFKRYLKFLPWGHSYRSRTSPIFFLFRIPQQMQSLETSKVSADMDCGLQTGWVMANFFLSNLHRPMMNKCWKFPKRKKIGEVLDLYEYPHRRNFQYLEKKGVLKFSIHLHDVHGLVHLIKIWFWLTKFCHTNTTHSKVQTSGNRCVHGYSNPCYFFNLPGHYQIGFASSLKVEWFLVNFR